MAPIITLTTDFGQGDYDTGVLTGVIWNLCPTAQVVDLTHQISRHNVLEAALTLDRCAPYFPEGTIHVVVVDPGVGTARRGLAARLGRQFFVGPDNGIMTPLLARVQASGEPVEIVQLAQNRYHLPQVSAIFHGRDVFAPAAAHLAGGLPLSELGPPVNNPVLIEIPQPQPIAGGWLGAVQHVDFFGNLSTNLERRHLPPKDVEIRLAQQCIRGLVRTFSDGRPGDLVALMDSSGKLCISVVNGSAAARLGVDAGQPVEVVAGHE